MKHLLSFCIALLAASPAFAGDPAPLPARYQPFEKSARLKLRQALGSPELHPTMGHTSAFSRDGKVAVFVSHVVADDMVRDSNLWVWDLEKRRLTRELPLPGLNVTALTLTPDGRSALVGSESGKDKKTFAVALLDLASGKIVHKLGDHAQHISAAVVNPSGEFALTACAGQLKFWNLNKRSLVKAIPLAADQPVFALAFVPGKTQALCGLLDKVALIDLNDGKTLKTMEGHTDLVLGVAVARDAKTAVSASFDGSVRSWSLNTGKQTGVLQKQSTVGQLWISLALADDDKSVLSCWSDLGFGAESGPATVSLWPVAGKKETWTKPGTFRGVVPIRVEGKSALFGGGASPFCVVGLADGEAQSLWGGHKGTVNAVASLGDGRLVTAGQEGTVIVWDKGSDTRAFTAHAAPVNTLALGKGILVTGSADKSAKAWDFDTGKLLHTLAGHTGNVVAVAVSKDGAHAFTASEDHTVKIWDLKTGKALATLTGHSESVNALALSADEAWLATGSDDTTIRLWPLKSGRLDPSREAMILDGHKRQVGCLAFSADGKTLASGSQDQTIKLWDWTTGKATKTLAGHKNWVTALAFVQPGVLASASDDLTLRLWDADSGKQLDRLDFGVLGDGPRCLASRPGGVATGTSSWLVLDFDLK